ncbi:MAG: hypothetical protein IPK16_28685 [Anaerolineales bacterium]|nr:hypothetical protein [Anaerolineales bacterium]
MSTLVHRLALFLFGLSFALCLLLTDLVSAQATAPAGAVTPTPGPSSPKAAYAPEVAPPPVGPTPTPTLTVDKLRATAVTVAQNPACVTLGGYGSYLRFVIVPAGFYGDNATDVADFQRLARKIADGFAAVEPYKSYPNRYTVYRADDYRGAIINPRSNDVWYNATLIAAAGVCDYDQIIVVARNSGWAGGALGYYSVVGSGTPPTCNRSTCTGVDCPWTPTCSWDDNIAFTALHESGHTVGGFRHTCDPATQQVEIARLAAMERLELPEQPRTSVSSPYNCGTQYTGSSTNPCAEWNNVQYLDWVVVGQPTFGCYATCGDRNDWYRPWNGAPTMMCLDYNLVNGYTPVERHELGHPLGVIYGVDLVPEPVVVSSRQGTNTADAVYAGSRAFIDWYISNKGNRPAYDLFYIELWIDDVRLARYPNYLGLDKNVDKAGFLDWAETMPADGWHEIKVKVDPDNLIAEANESNNVGSTWIYVTAISGWKGEYFKTADLNGNPWLTRDDAAIAFEWYGNAPDPALPTDGFSVRWTRTVNFSAGTYVFSMHHDDGVRFYVDGTLVFENWCNDCRLTDKVQLAISSGDHALKLEMFENGGWAAASLSWVAIPRVSFSTDIFTATEDAGWASFQAVLNKTWSERVTVAYSAGRYGSGTLTFEPGVTSNRANVPITDDAIDDPDQTDNLYLYNPTNATLSSPNSAVLRIIDNESPPKVRFTSATYLVTEQTANVPVEVRLSGKSAYTITVAYASQGLASGRLTFPPGVTSRSFTVPIAGDVIDEPDQNIQLTLANPVNASLGLPASAKLTVQDNDDPVKVRFSSATYTAAENAGTIPVEVRLSNRSGYTVKVFYDVAGIASGWLTFAPDVTSRTLDVPITNNTIDNPDQIVTMTLSNAANATLGLPAVAKLTITDNDVPPKLRFSTTTYTVLENAGKATIGVNLGAKSGYVVTVNYKAGALAAGQLTFAAGVTSRTFSVPITDDQIDEPNQVVALTLSNPSHAGLGDPYTAKLTIQDNDPPASTNPEIPDDTGAGLRSNPGEESTAAAYEVHLAYSARDAGGEAGDPTAQLPVLQVVVPQDSVRESTGVALFAITLSTPALETVVADYRITVQGAQTATGQVAFAPGETRVETPATFSIDSRHEPDREISLAVINATNAQLGVSTSASVTIQDDGAPPVAGFESADYAAHPLDGATTVDVSLSVASGYTVTIWYMLDAASASRDTDAETARSALVFAPGETSRPILVTWLPEAGAEGRDIALLLADAEHAVLGERSRATLHVASAANQLYLPNLGR